MKEMDMQKSYSNPFAIECLEVEPIGCFQYKRTAFGHIIIGIVIVCIYKKKIWSRSKAPLKTDVHVDVVDLAVVLYQSWEENRFAESKVDFRPGQHKVCAFVGLWKPKPIEGEYTGDASIRLNPVGNFTIKIQPAAIEVLARPCL